MSPTIPPRIESETEVNLPSKIAPITPPAMLQKIIHTSFNMILGFPSGSGLTANFPGDADDQQFLAVPGHLLLPVLRSNQRASLDEESQPRLHRGTSGLLDGGHDLDHHPFRSRLGSDLAGETGRFIANGDGARFAAAKQNLWSGNHQSISVKGSSI